MYQISSAAAICNSRQWFLHNLLKARRVINHNFVSNGNNNTDGNRPLLLVIRRYKSDKLQSSSTTKYPAHKIISTTPAAAAGQDTTNKAAVLPWWIVQHANTVAIVPVLGNLAYASLAGGFLCSDVLSLRILLVCGYSGLVTYHALRPKPLLIPLRWSAFFVVVNLAMVAMLIFDQLPPGFTEEEEELHVHHFAPLSLKSFRALLDIGTRRVYKDGDLLTVANQACDTLFFIVSGRASMTNTDGKHISKLQRGSFPNCMSFQRSGWDSTRRNSSIGSSNNNNIAYGTILCEGDVECIVWNSEDLHALLDTSTENDDIRLRMDHVVIEAVIGRLLVDSEGANVTDYIRVISQGWAHENVQQRKIKSMTLTATKDK